MNLVLWTVFISIIGLLVGSFINVVVFRSKSNEPFWRGRSKCRTCEEPIAAVDLVPVVSFFALKGRCRQCSATIEWQYPLVEIVCGVLFGVFFARAALAFGLPEWLNQADWVALFIRDIVIGMFLVVIFVYDLRYTYILDRFSIPAMVIALVFNIGLGANPADLLFGGFLIGAFFAIQYLVSGGKWVGGGDVRMGMLMGFLLGIAYGLVALFLAYIIGAIVGIGLIALKKRKMDSQVPFGTFLTGATIIAMIFGKYILEWYMGFFG